MPADEFLTADVSIWITTCLRRPGHIWEIDI